MTRDASPLEPTEAAAMADDDTTTEPETKPEEKPAEGAAKPEELGDGGKKALDAERRRAAAAERKAKQLEAELEAARLESASDQEKALAAARKEGETEGSAKANNRILKSEIKALAAKKLNDPNDAVSLLELSQFEVDADGNVDEKAIESAIDELVAAKPYLANGAKPAAGSADGGAREPEATQTVEQQIAELEGKGEFAKARQLKTQLLANHLANR